jgi:hypothetical protein
MRIHSSVSPRGGFRAVNRIEKLLIVEEGLGEFGKQLTWVAVPLVAVLELHASVSKMAILATGTGAAALVGGAVNSSMTRWLSLQIRVYLSCLLTALALLLVPATTLFGFTSMNSLYVSAVITGFVGPMFRVAFMTVVQRQVSAADVLVLNGRINLVQSIISVGSPTLVGLTATVVDPSLLLVVDAATWLVSAVILGRLSIDRVVEQEGPADDDEPRYEAAPRSAHSPFTPVVTAGIFCEVAWIFGRACIGTVAVLYIIDKLNFGSTAVGVVFTIAGLGFVIGAALAGIAGSRLGYARLSGIVAITAVACAGGLLATPVTGYVALGGVALFTAASAMGYILLDVTLTSWRQTNLSESDLGIVASWADSAGTATRLGAGIVAGIVGTIFGLSILMVVVGALFVALSFMLGPVLTRATKDLNYVAESAL